MFDFWMSVFMTGMITLGYIVVKNGLMTDHYGKNDYGKYEIKTFETKDGKKVYVPLCYVGKLFFKSRYRPYDARNLNYKQVENLGEGYYGWYNKMECIDYLEKEWNNKLKRKEYKKRLHDLSKDI